MRRATTLRLVFAAMFAALAVVLSIYPFTFYLPDSSRITFREIPIYLCSFTLGPVFGGLCAFISDLVGTFISNSGAAWNPLFALNAVLTGVLPGVLFRYVFKNEKPISHSVSHCLLLHHIHLQTITPSFLYSFT